MANSIILLMEKRQSQEEKRVTDYPGAPALTFARTRVTGSPAESFESHANGISSLPLILCPFYTRSFMVGTLATPRVTEEFWSRNMLTVCKVQLLTWGLTVDIWNLNPVHLALMEHCHCSHVPLLSVITMCIVMSDWDNRIRQYTVCDNSN